MRLDELEIIAESSPRNFINKMKAARKGADIPGFNEISIDVKNYDASMDKLLKKSQQILKKF